MKYWIGTGPKAGQCGTMDDTGKVPDSSECSKTQYTHWLSLQPIPQKVESDLERVVRYVKAQPGGPGYFND